MGAVSSVSLLHAKTKYTYFEKQRSRNSWLHVCEPNVLSSDSEDADVLMLAALQGVVRIDVSESVWARSSTLRSCLVSKERGAGLVSCSPE